MARPGRQRPTVCRRKELGNLASSISPGGRGGGVWKGEAESHGSHYNILFPVLC